ncbi:MAG: biotin--[acetyl-CoA-carboxylase] ligase [Flavobacteriales bacterium]
MKTLFLGKEKIQLATVESTNNYAAKLASLPHWIDGTAIVAELQTKGKGQMGSTWLGEAGNLFCSFLLKLPFLSPQTLPNWNQAVSLAVFDTVKKFHSDQLWIKWPNDVICKEGKVAGILIENALQATSIKHSIIGIGINTQCAPNIEGAACLNELPNKDDVFSELALQLEKRYFQLKAKNSDAIKLDYNEQLWMLGKPCHIKVKEHETKVLFQGQNHKGNALFLDHNGPLELGIKEFQWISLPY